MMTPKEALQKDGTIPVKMGKGRLSKEGIERCKWLVANEGWQILGYAVESSPKAVDTPVAVKQVQPQNVKVVQEFTILYHKDDYKAVADDGREFGMPEVCTNCSVSLVQCHCGNPSILGGTIPVTIVRK